ncbi:MAG: FMN-binding protein, partial [Clostridia bacterium]|nr:FMN-binding protein [Clostridia bacterium]
MNKKVPSLVVLCIICLVAGLLLSFTDKMTAEKIVQQEAISKEAARASVLDAADHFDALELQESRFNMDNAYAGLDADGNTVGYVGQTTVTGFGGPIEVLTGLDMEGVVTGISVGGADFSETAGLGALTKEAGFTDQFKGKVPTFTLNENGVDSVTGASTSSRAVISGVNTVSNYLYTYELGLLEEETEVYTGATTSASEKGFGGDVTVTIGKAADGTIEYLSIDTPAETDGLGKLCSEKAFTSQFIGKAGPFTYGEDGIEAVSGATFTSTAAINAINTIMAGGGTESAEPVSTTVKGFGGDVTVTARLKADNSIEALTIDTPSETDGLGKRASEPDFTNQFIGKMAPFTYGEDGIDALAGATVTSTAVIDALNAIVPAGDKSTLPVVEEAPTEPEVTAEPEAPAEAAAPAEAVVLTDGTYTVSKSTAFSTIDVEATVEGGKITDAKVTSAAIEGSVDMLTDDSRAQFAQQIVHTQGQTVDAVSGVTISSDAIREAAGEILAQASASEAAPAEEAAPVEEAPAEEAAPVEEAAPAEAVALTDGTYTVSKSTAFSTIDVEATVEGGKITDAKVTSAAIEGSVDMLTDDSRAQFAKQIVDTQGQTVDAVSGVTISSDAIREAAGEILAQASAGE